MELMDFSALIFIRYTETSDLLYFLGYSDPRCGGPHYTKQAALILVGWLNVSRYINTNKFERKGKKRREKEVFSPYFFPAQHDFLTWSWVCGVWSFTTACKRFWLACSTNMPTTYCINYLGLIFPFYPIRWSKCFHHIYYL